VSAAISIQFCAAGEDSAGRVPCACFAESAFTKKRWQKLRDAQDERLRFQVERYIWDRAEGKPSTLKSRTLLINGTGLFWITFSVEDSWRF